MLVIRTEAYKEKEPNTYSSFMFDTNIDTGTPYYINSIKNEILQINGTINAIKRDINNIIEEYTLADKFPDLLKDTKNAFDKTTTELSNDISSIIDAAGQYLEALYNQSEISLDNLNELNQSINYSKDPDADKSVLATIGTGALGVIEGLGDFGQDLVKAGTIVGTVAATPVMWGLDKYQENKYAGTNVNWDPMVDSMWKDTAGYLKTDDNKAMFDDFYNSTAAGNYLKENSYDYQDTRNEWKTAGYIVPAALTVYGTFSGIGSGATASTAEAVGASLYRGPSVSVLSIPTAAITGSAVIVKNGLADDANQQPSFHREYEHLDLGPRYLTDLNYERAVAEYNAKLEISSKPDSNDKDSTVSENEISK